MCSCSEGSHEVSQLGLGDFTLFNSSSQRYKSTCLFPCGPVAHTLLQGNTFALVTYILCFRLRWKLFDSTLAKTLMTLDEPIQLLQSCTSLSWLTLHGALCPFNLKGLLRGLGTYEACPYMEWKDSSSFFPHSAWEQGKNCPTAVVSWENLILTKAEEKKKNEADEVLTAMFYHVCSHVILPTTTGLLGAFYSHKSYPDSFDSVPLHKV